MKNQSIAAFQKFIIVLFIGIFFSCIPDILLKPIIATHDASIITESTVVAGGYISSDGGSPVSERGLCWSRKQNPTIKDSKTTESAGPGTFVSTATGLASGTVYYLRAYATNKAGTAYGLQITITTRTISLTTTPAYFILSTSAMTGGSIDSDGDSVAVQSRGVCWNTFPNPTIKDSITVNGSGKGTFNSMLTGLMPLTTYYLRAYATSSFGTTYGNEISFNTQSGTINLSTGSASAIKASTATLSGNITGDGGEPIIKRGLCWNTNPNPTIDHFKYANGNSTGFYYGYLTGLTANTTYYCRAFATNAAGTFYGNESIFTTMNGVINIQTTNATLIYTTSLFTGGSVVSDGGSTLTDIGVCWSTTQNPTTLNSKKSLGSGSSNYNTSITSLTPLTTYYVRAYATNSIGTYYGNQITATTTDVDPSTVTDVDGNEYATIRIGNQLWMASNLRTTRYRNGDPIVNMTDYLVWVTLTSGAYCDYDNSSSNGTTYGHLYNWFAVNDSRKIAPTGWHIPTDAEWEVLVTYLGGSSLAGGKMKETGTTHWLTPNYGATNGSGFNGLPGGGSNTRGWNITIYGFWWSSTEYNTSQAWYRYLSKDDTYVVRTYNNTKTMGYSVRCIKD